LAAGLRRAWAVVFDLGYEALRGLVLLFFRPLFLLRREGPPPALPGGRVIVCANHASYLDPAFVQLVLRRRVIFVMTNDFYRRRWGRWFFRLVGAIPVGPGRFAKDGLERAVSHLRRDRVIGIFPEGRLSPDGTLGDAQRGVAVIARLGRAPVLPMGIVGNLRAWPKGAPCFRRSDVRVAFGSLLPPPESTEPRGRSEEQAYADRILRAIAEARKLAHGRGRAPVC
jgi:1-acyl-sn-glycerol-3-phosphate acyltransferase